MSKKIVAFGEVVWDILPRGNILGGTPSNLVFRCNSFNESGFLLSRVGDDGFGIEAVRRLQQLGISVDNVQTDKAFPTGTVHISFGPENEPIYKVTPDVAFDHIEFSAEALKLARNADCLCYGLLAQRFGISKNTIRELIKESPDSIHFFDLKLFEHFFDIAVVHSMLECSNIVRIKEKEIEFLASKLGLKNGDPESFGKQLCERYNLDVILITRGSNGVFAYDNQGVAFVDKGYIIDLVDNIGSGMAFSAGFLHYYLNGESIQDAICFGNAAGALNSTRLGATSYFNKEDVIRFMKNTLQK